MPYDIGIVRKQVNDPQEPDSYDLHLGRRSYNLIELLTQLDKSEQLYLLDALSQAREQEQQN